MFIFEEFNIFANLHIVKILEAFALNLDSKTGNFMQRDDKHNAHDPGVSLLIVAGYTSTSNR
ncbi:hypothetical protein [Salegentibacter sp. F14]